MEARELRIGNVLKSTISRDRGGTFAILAIKDGYVSFSQLNNDYIWQSIENTRPVRITPEIFEKIKEAEKNVTHFVLPTPTHDITLVPDANSWGAYFLDLPEDECYIRSIKFVHQLQNIYFALSGEELKIEL